MSEENIKKVGRPPVQKIKEDSSNSLIDYKFEGNGLIDDEFKYGKKLFENYRKYYHIDNFSDLRLLEELCRRETYQEMSSKARVDLANARDSEDVTDKTAKQALIKKLEKRLSDLPDSDNNMEQILILKEKLGLFKEKNTDDPFKYIETLKKKFEIWKSNNQASRTRMCPHCSKMIMLAMKMDAWDLAKHPHFIDKTLANEEMWKWVRSEKITKEELAKALHVSTDYIDEIEKRLFRKTGPNSADIVIG